MPRNTKASAIVTPPATAKAVAAETIKKLKATTKAVAPATAKAVASLPKAGNPAQAHALETLQDFLKSPDYQKPSPVLHLYSAEKATFLRDYLKVAKVRAEAQNKTPLKFITIKS